MERIFQKLAMAFGNQMVAKWGGLDQQEVYTDWAESMQEFSLGAINHGIEAAKEQPHPPSQGEFKTLCRGYKPALPTMLEHKLSPEQIEKNRVRIAEMVRSLAEKKVV